MTIVIMRSIALGAYNVYSANHCDSPTLTVLIFIGKAKIRYRQCNIHFNVGSCEPYSTICPISICPYVFSCKMFVKGDFFVYSHLEHSSDEKKKGLHFFLTL